MYMITLRVMQEGNRWGGLTKILCVLHTHIKTIIFQAEFVTQAIQRKGSHPSAWTSIHYPPRIVRNGIRNIPRHPDIPQMRVVVMSYACASLLASADTIPIASEHHILDKPRRRKVGPCPSQTRSNKHCCACSTGCKSSCGSKVGLMQCDNIVHDPNPYENSMGPSMPSVIGIILVPQ